MIGRREFLRLGAFGGLGSLADLMRLKASAPGSAARPAKSLVVIWLSGGPSQLDTYDLKPAAPEEVRGEYKPIATSVPGVRICELFPRQAAIVDRLAILRAVVGGEGHHTDSQVMTGWGATQDPRRERPSVGAVISKVGKTRRTDVPPFVSLMGRTPGLEPGILGVAHRAFAPGGMDTAALQSPKSENADRLDERRGLLEQFDRASRWRESSGEASALDAFQQRAFDVITSGAVRRALNLDLEPQRVRERYGSASQLVTARRLVEAGVGCVTVRLAGRQGGEWDTHSDNYQTLDRLLPVADQGISAFAEDLFQRGLEKDVVVLAWGEMGRTPKINPQAGRDHWGKVMSCLLWGGGLKGGQVVGATDGWAGEAKDRPVSIQSVLATAYHALGIDPSAALTDRAGRPVYLLEDQEPIRELI